MNAMLIRASPKKINLVPPKAKRYATSAHYYSARILGASSVACAGFKRPLESSCGSAQTITEYEPGLPDIPT
jgi:hypothetical protein